MTCPDKGTFLDLLWGHYWTTAICHADKEIQYSGDDPQPALIALESTCLRCSSQMEWTITQVLSLHKAAFTSRADPDVTIYFRRTGTRLRQVGIDEYICGYGDEVRGQCDVCGYQPGTLDVGLCRICTVCWGFLKPWLNAVANPRAELVDSPAASENGQAIKIAHQAGVIEAKLRTDPQLAAEMKAADELILAGSPVDLAGFRARLDAIELDLDPPVFYIVAGVRDSE